MLKPNSTILFHGDSITDAGRTYDNQTSLGEGYPLMVKQYLDIFHRDLDITVVNRGVSGFRSADLVAKWDADCIALNPDYVSILIGINDTWRSFDNNDPTYTEEYERNYRNILTKTATELDCQLIILEPFLIPSAPEKSAWRNDLDPKIGVARALAREFGAIYIPLDGYFAAKSTRVNPAYFSEDGVHPTTHGHAVIAKLWLDALCN